MRAWPFVATVLSAGLAGCAGGGGSIAAGSLASGNTQAPQSPTATVSIRVPAGTGTQAARRPQYVSAATAGVAVTEWPNGTQQPDTPTAVVALAAGTPPCTAVTAGAITCNLTLPAVLGVENFLVTTYDQPPLNGQPQGNVLSANTIQATIVLNNANQLLLALNGVPASLVVTPAVSFLPLGAHANLAFSVTALDADGDTIIGPGTYAAPIELAIADDPNTTLALSATTLTSPASTNVTLLYNGGAIPGAATITATTAGATSALLSVQAIQGLGVPVTVPAATPIL